MHETIFPETYEYCEKKIWGKNRLKKMRKNVFCIHTNIVTKKWGQKNARINFSRNNDFCELKMLGKNRL